MIILRQIYSPVLVSSYNPFSLADTLRALGVPGVIVNNIEPCATVACYLRFLNCSVVSALTLRVRCMALPEVGLLVLVGPVLLV